MNLSLRNPAPEFLDAAEQLYLESFPPEERRPWGDIVSGPAGPELRLIFRDGAFAGIITTWDLGTWTYVEHFAIMPYMRGGGIGGLVLERLAGMDEKPLLLEVERPGDGNPMASRRIEFYRRNGFALLDYDYIQPPYAPGLPEVPLRLMCTDPATDAETATRALHTQVYGTAEP